MLDSDKLAGNPLTLGLLGSLITAVRFMPGATLKERLANIAAGLIIAAVGTPVLVEWLHMKSQAYASGAAFLIGLTGVSLAAAVLNAIKAVPLADIVNGWLSRKG